MQSRKANVSPAVKSSYGLYFKQYSDITDVIKRTLDSVELKASEVQANSAQLTKQFIVANDGRTYIKNEIIKAHLNGNDFSHLKFLTVEGSFLGIDFIIRAKDKLIDVLVNNRMLADYIILLASTSRGTILTMDLPACGIGKLPVIFPAITFTGFTYELYAIEELVRRKENEPYAKTPITNDNMVRDLSLQDFIATIFHVRLKHKNKVKAQQAPGESIPELLQDMFEMFDEQKIDLLKHLAIQHTHYNTEEYARDKNDKRITLNRLDLSQQPLEKLTDKIFEKRRQLNLPKINLALALRLADFLLLQALSAMSLFLLYWKQYPEQRLPACIRLLCALSILSTLTYLLISNFPKSTLYTTAALSLSVFLAGPAYVLFERLFSISMKEYEETLAVYRYKSLSDEQRHFIDNTAIKLSEITSYQQSISQWDKEVKTPLQSVSLLAAPRVEQINEKVSEESPLITPKS